MRVTTETVDEFIECLRTEANIFGDTIRVSISRTPIDGPKHSACKFNVNFHASAIVITGPGEYILQTGQSCGKDYEDASQEKKGSEKAAELKSKILEYAAQRNWKVLPGVISE